MTLIIFSCSSCGYGGFTHSLFWLLCCLPSSYLSFRLHSFFFPLSSMIFSLTVQDSQINFVSIYVFIVFVPLCTCTTSNVVLSSVVSISISLSSLFVYHFLKFLHFRPHPSFQSPLAVSANFFLLCSRKSFPCVLFATHCSLLSVLCFLKSPRLPHSTFPFPFGLLVFMHLARLTISQFP